MRNCPLGRGDQEVRNGWIEREINPATVEVLIMHNIRKGTMVMYY